MIKSLVKLGILLVAGILIYNYFFGTAEEKAQSKEIFHKVGELAKESVALLKSEKQKFDAGKYDDAVDKVGNLFDRLRDKAEAIKDTGLLEDVEKLEKKRQAIKKQLEQTDPDDYGPNERAALKKQWDELMKETETLMNQLEE